MSNLFSVNSKMKKSSEINKIKVVNFTLPAYKTKDGHITCPNAKNCISGCYARMGAYIWSNVSKKHHENYEATKREDFVMRAVTEIKHIKADFVRVHDSGDFYNKEYLEKWLKIAKMLPCVKFYAYTKMVTMVKSVSIPSNFTIIFSMGGTEDNLINTNKDRHSKVFNDISTMPSKYIDASMDDMRALTQNTNIGLVYHGNKGYDKTTWGKV